MNPSIDNFFAHHWLILFVGYFMFSNFVSSMPTPNGGVGPGGWQYRWIFTFLHLCAGNAARIAATMAPKLFDNGALADPAQKR